MDILTLLIELNGETLHRVVLEKSPEKLHVGHQGLNNFRLCISWTALVNRRLLILKLKFYPDSRNSRWKGIRSSHGIVKPSISLDVTTHQTYFPIPPCIIMSKHICMAPHATIKYQNYQPFQIPNFSFPTGPVRSRRCFFLVRV